MPFLMNDRQQPSSAQAEADAPVILPALPKRTTSLMDGTPVYTADQMRAYARAAIAAQTAPADAVPPEGLVLAPHYRGYARLGIGAYLLNHSAAGRPAELVISVATEEDKAGRVVGDERENPHGNEIQPEVIAVRLRFEAVAGLDALEQRLRYLRAAHFPDTTAAPAAPSVPPGWTDAESDAARLALELECLLTDRDMPTATVSRWWDSAQEALQAHRERLAAAPTDGGQGHG